MTEFNFGGVDLDGNSFSSPNRPFFGGRETTFGDVFNKVLLGLPDLISSTFNLSSVSSIFQTTAERDLAFKEDLFTTVKNNVLAFDKTDSKQAFGLQQNESIFSSIENTFGTDFASNFGKFGGNERANLQQKIAENGSAFGFETILEASKTFGSLGDSAVVLKKLNEDITDLRKDIGLTS